MDESNGVDGKTKKFRLVFKIDSIAIFKIYKNGEIKYLAIVYILSRRVYHLLNTCS